VNWSRTYHILLILHIVGGALSLSAPIVALAATKGTRWHIVADERVFSGCS
jgi:hypothetical protein